MKQVVLERGGWRRVCWINIDEKVKEGDLVSLKGNDPKEWFRVEAIYAVEIEKKEVNRTWHVGGL